jgi:hypothetical protein
LQQGGGARVTEILVPKNVFKRNVEKDRRVEELRKLNEALNTPRANQVNLADVDLSNKSQKSEPFSKP